MSVLTQLLSRHHPRTPDKALFQEVAKAENSSGENLWCAATFLMFIALGPFAAIPVLFSMFSLAPGEEAEEPETVET
jgi:hypothetical protein